MILFLLGILILLCIAANRISDKIGLPALVAFMLLGMFFGCDGPFHIQFDDFKLSETICSTALIFIMFYGGFNLKWKAARPIAIQAISLSTLGVAGTVFVATFCLHFLLGLEWKEAFLICSVLGSTDAASVFSILRRQKLNLKDNTAPLLEMESGSNDPISYMMTLIGIQMLTTGIEGNILVNIALQLIVGLAMGFVFAWLTQRLFRIQHLISSSMASLFLIGMVILCYSMANGLQGNAFLSVYVMGIVLGNKSLPFKADLISFFDSLTGMAQILIFFLLGLLSYPASTFRLLKYSLTIFLVLLFIARPLIVSLILKCFKASWPKCMLVSFAGLCGAASCVFAAMAVAAGVPMGSDLFQIVFAVTLLSVSVQGSLLPWAARKLDMTDDREDVFRTFNDYVEENSLSLMRVFISKNHKWANKQVKEIRFPENSLALLVNRKGTSLVCKGDTLILPGDILILSVPPYKPAETELLEERTLSVQDPWVNHSLAQLNLGDDLLVAMVRRDHKVIIPDGSTILQPDDTVVLYRGDDLEALDRGSVKG